MSILAELNPKVNEIIRVKFKTIDQILKQSHRSFTDSDEYYGLGDNHKAMMMGMCDFVVSEDYEHDDDETPDERAVIVKNHLDWEESFWIRESMIESAEIVDDSERWQSMEHGVIVVRVDYEMFINGKPMIWDEDYQREYHDDRKMSNEPPYENKNRRLLKIFENYVADLAVRESFKEQGEQ